MKIWVRLSLGLAILGILFWKVGLGEMAEILKGTDVGIFLIALLIYLLFLFIKSITLFLFMEPAGDGLTYLSYLRYFIVSWVTTLFLPGRVGEFLVLSMLKKDGVTLGKGSAAVMTDKLITLGVSLSMACVGFAVFFSSDELILLLGVSVVGIVGLLFMISQKGRLLIRKYILRKYASRFKGFSKELFANFIDRKGTVLLNALLTFLGVIVLSISLWTLFISLDVSVPLIYVILIGSVQGIMMLVPFTVNGLGFAQGAGVYLFVKIGVPVGIAAAQQALGTVVPYLIGLVFLVFLGDRIRKRIS